MNRPGFERGGLARARFDSESMVYVDDVYERADAFLSAAAPISCSPAAGCAGRSRKPDRPRLEDKPRDVASNSLTEPGWADTTVLVGDLAAAVRDAKAKPRGELGGFQGSSQHLMANW
jgi:hypothetical protein